MKPTSSRPKSKPAKTTPTKKHADFHWGIALILGFIIGANLWLRTAEVSMPRPTSYVNHALEDDLSARIKLIESNYPKLAQPPRLMWSNEPVTVISMQYLLLLNSPTAKSELNYFERAMAAIMASQQHVQSKPTIPVAPPAPQITGINLPILMYHRTPADFEQQISYLYYHGYTAVSFADLVAAINHHGSLPAKPVIITLDDGYADQMNEINILRRYNMKATLFMIVGGAASNWCIGANAKGLPGCESYLNWDQLRALDKEGLITIGGHTINHPNLASLNAEQQRSEIIGGKQAIEAQLGHPIYDFAYPYGSFNATSIQIARQAGYREAVSTIAGTIHNNTTLYSLHRVRDSLKLP